jgi:uncharacterized protein
VKVVCDTNVLVAGIIAEGLCYNIVKRRLPTVELFTSKSLLDELADKVMEKLDAEPDDLPLLVAYRENVSIVEPRKLPQPVCRDPDDDEVLATAIAAEADIILTGDLDLLILKIFHGIKILSPRQFVELLDKVK